MTRIIPTLDLESSLFVSGSDIVVGFDEVGRGALAGPVMVGAAALTRNQVADRLSEIPEGLADSKLLTEKRRESLFEPLQEWVAAWGVGAATNREIDEWGISHALGVAALHALATVEEQLNESAVLTPFLGGILDGPNDYISKNVSTLDAPAISVVPKVTTQVKADQTCASVAAASVLAKVSRDRIMVELGSQQQYSAFGWAKNKGYGSKAHREAIREVGPSDLHRLSWHLV